MCSVSVSEMQTRLEFDIDSNGEVSEDEAKVIVYCLHFSEEMFLFVDVSIMLIEVNQYNKHFARL